MSREIKFGPRIDFKGGVPERAPLGVRTPVRPFATPLQRLKWAAERKMANAR